MDKTLPPFIDAANLSEDERIMVIGGSVMGLPSDKPAIVGFVVEDEAKAARYIQKLKENFPGIRIIDTIKKCPLPGMITVKIGSPLQ